MRTPGAALLVMALGFCAGGLIPQTRSQAHRFQEAIDLMETRGDYPAAVRLFEEISKGPDRAVAARALLYVGLCYEKLGKGEAEKAYQRLIRDFAEQGAVVTEARARLVRLGRPPGSIPGATMTARRIWDGPGVDLVGSLSPDGRFLSYVDSSTGDLAIRELATGVNRRLTSNGPSSTSNEFAQYSVFSPDGKQVAYAWADKNEAWDLRVVDVGGSEPRVLYRGEEVEYLEPAQWSPDAKSILALLRTKDRTNQIALVSVADGSVKVLKTLDWRRPVKMSYSPNGRSIVYDLPPQDDAPERDIYLLAADASRETRLVEHPANDLQPVWTPDGKQVVFMSDRMRTFDAWAIRVTNGKPEGSPELLKSNMGHVWPWGFARNGSYFYGLQTGRGDVYIASIDPADGAFLAAPKPASQRFLGSHAWPDWSPDGKRLAFVHRPGLAGPGGFSPILCIQSLETGRQRELLPRLTHMSRLRWSPDGRSILLNGRDHNYRGGLYRIDVESGEVQAIIHSGPSQGYPRQSGWLGDGSAVLYKHFDSPISRRDLASGREQEIYQGASTFDLSPDGRWLALGSWEAAKKAAVLKIAPASGGEPREILRLPESGTFSLTLTWTRDSRFILFTRRRAAAEEIAELWRVPAEGGEPQRLGLAMEGLHEVRVHPDGQRIAFGGGRDKYEVWVMENFLPGRRETR